MTGKKFDSRSTIVWDEARLDISAGGFWTKYQIEYFDVRVFDLNVKRYESKSLQQYYRTNEMERNKSIPNVFSRLKMEVHPISFFDK